MCLFILKRKGFTKYKLSIQLKLPSYRLSIRENRKCPLLFINKYGILFVKKMEKRFVFTVLALVALQSIVMAADMDPEQKKECLRQSKRVLKNMMKNFKACNDKLKLHHISGEEYQKKIGCVVKCVMQALGSLDDNDYMTSESLKKSLEAHIPPQYTEITHEKLMVCVNQIKLDPKDENCKTYLDIGTCMQGAMVEICGEPPLM